MQQVGPFGGVITLVHFISLVSMPPLDHEGPPTPQWRIACMPNMTEFHETMYHPSYHRTDHAPAASCPQCKKTREYTQAMERANVAGKR